MKLSTSLPRLCTVFLATCVIGITRTAVAEESAKTQAAKLVPLNYALGKPATASGSQHAHEPNFATEAPAKRDTCLRK